MDRAYLPYKSDNIPRPRLDALLKQGLASPLITITAGPGYGKTQAAASFAMQHPGCVVWLSLSPQDDDPYTFWEKLLAETQRELPALSAALSNLGLPLSGGEINSFLRILAQEAVLHDKTLLLIDDWENITDPHIIALYRALVGAELENLCLVLCSREAPPSGESYLPGGQLHVGPEDLAFTEDEARALFQNRGLPCTEADIQEMMQQTGGWAFALNAVCLRGGVDGCANGSYFFAAAEFFEANYYSTYPKALRHLLVQLSQLPAFPVHLIRHLAGDAADAALEFITRHSYISYNFATQLFHFQKMYGEFLQLKLGLLSPEESTALFSFAGDWFRAAHYPAEAAHCFWRIADHARLVATILEVPRGSIRGASVGKALRYLGDIPRQYAAAHPEADYCRAMLLLNDLPQLDEAQDILTGLSQKLTAGNSAQETRLLGNVCLALSAVCRLKNQAGTLEYARRAAQLLPGGNCLQQPEQIRIWNTYTFYLPGHTQKTVDEMLAYAAEYEQYIQTATAGGRAGYALLYAAEAMYFTGQMDRAWAYGNEAILKAQLAQQHDIVCNALWVLARIQLYRGRTASAWGSLGRMSAIIQGSQATALYELHDCATAWLHLQRGEADKIPQWLTDTYFMGNAYPMALGRNRILTASYLLHKGSYITAQALLQQLQTAYSGIGMWAERLYMAIVQALLCFQRGQAQQSAAHLAQACETARPHNVLLPFVEFGKMMQSLIDAARRQSDIAFDKNWLNTIYRLAGSYEKRVAPKTGEAAGRLPSTELNPKERQTLEHLYQGLTRTEIAEVMGTSLGSIKNYIAGIYTKLGAINRADAIHIAVANGLLPTDV